VLPSVIEATELEAAELEVIVEEVAAAANAVPLKI
jgi:hypothetical protein